MYFYTTDADFPRALGNETLKTTGLHTVDDAWRDKPSAGYSFGNPIRYADTLIIYKPEGAEFLTFVQQDEVIEEECAAKEEAEAQLKAEPFEKEELKKLLASSKHVFVN